jgi:hypothetical protein
MALPKRRVHFWKRSLLIAKTRLPQYTGHPHHFPTTRNGCCAGFSVAVKRLRQVQGLVGRTPKTELPAHKCAAIL